jgi:hypothetical protein
MFKNIVNYLPTVKSCIIGIIYIIVAYIIVYFVLDCLYKIFPGDPSSHREHFADVIEEESDKSPSSEEPIKADEEANESPGPIINQEAEEEEGIDTNKDVNIDVEEEEEEIDTNTDVDIVVEEDNDPISRILPNDDTISIRPVVVYESEANEMPEEILANDEGVGSAMFNSANSRNNINTPPIPNAQLISNTPPIPNAQLISNTPPIPNTPLTSNTPPIPNTPPTTNTPTIQNTRYPSNSPNPYAHGPGQWVDPEIEVGAIHSYNNNRNGRDTHIGSDDGHGVNVVDAG